MKRRGLLKFMAMSPLFGMLYKLPSNVDVLTKEEVKIEEETVDYRESDNGGYIKLDKGVWHISYQAKLQKDVHNFSTLSSLPMTYSYVLNIDRPGVYNIVGFMPDAEPNKKWIAWRIS